MVRVALALVALYGFKVSRRASRNIRAVQAQAVAGDRKAQQHFTQTRYARLVGIPNSDLGMVYYAALFAASASGALRGRWMQRTMLLSSAASILTSIYLLWALFKLRVLCRVCLAGHAANIVTGALLLCLRLPGRTTPTH